MGTHHQYGYSADVEGFLVVGSTRFRLAKTNDRQLTLAESCELPPGTEAELLIIVDGEESSRRVILPAGVALGQTLVNYSVAVPF